MTISELLDEMDTLAGKREETRRWLVKRLQALGMRCELQAFDEDAANVIANRHGGNRVVLSAHYDGDDLNDNMAAVAILLKLAAARMTQHTMLLFTDLEEQGGKGMLQFLRRPYSRRLPMVVLELVGVGDRTLLGTSTFAKMPMYVEVTLDRFLTTVLQGCAQRAGIPHELSAVPPGDHFAYATSGGRCALLSRACGADLEVIRRMRNGVVPTDLFNGLNREETAIGRIHPFGRTSKAEISVEAVRDTFKVLRGLLKHVQRPMAVPQAQ